MFGGELWYPLVSHGPRSAKSTATWQTRSSPQSGWRDTRKSGTVGKTLGFSIGDKHAIISGIRMKNDELNDAKLASKTKR